MTNNIHSLPVESFVHTESISPELAHWMKDNFGLLATEVGENPKVEIIRIDKDRGQVEALRGRYVFPDGSWVENNVDTNGIVDEGPENRTTKSHNLKIAGSSLTIVREIHGRTKNGEDVIDKGKSKLTFYTAYPKEVKSAWIKADAEYRLKNLE